MAPLHLYAYTSSSEAAALLSDSLLVKLLMLSVSSVVSQAYNHPLPARTISDQVYANMPRFSINGSRATAHFCNLIVNER
ncbi:hypothetical protein BDFG_04148 [Blastomyces dermatitidis ATCC 26199]|nr:hypothetical protein BDFG_04148 [Blastomyces dermatitidis ATCC 26199]